MVVIHFYRRGETRPIKMVRWPVVPRVGESVRLDAMIRQVKAVHWSQAMRCVRGRWEEIEGAVEANVTLELGGCLLTEEEAAARFGKPGEQNGKQRHSDSEDQ